METKSKPTTLQYTSTDLSYSNVLLIDSNVENYEQLVASCNSSTFPIAYNYYSSKQELQELLTKTFWGQQSFTRLAIVFSQSSQNPKMFLDLKPIFTYRDTKAKPDKLSDNAHFLVDIINKFHVQHVDFLACDTLLYYNWKCCDADPPDGRCCRCFER